LIQADATSFWPLLIVKGKKIQAVNGLQMVHVTEVGEGQSVIIARYDSEESAVAATETIQGILGGMAEFMTAPPNRRGGPIMWEM
jgi:hypothetical protein